MSHSVIAGQRMCRSNSQVLDVTMGIPPNDFIVWIWIPCRTGHLSYGHLVSSVIIDDSSVQLRIITLLFGSCWWIERRADKKESIRPLGSLYPWTFPQTLRCNDRYQWFFIAVANALVYGDGQYGSLLFFELWLWCISWYPSCFLNEKQCFRAR